MHNERVNQVKIFLFCRKQWNRKRNYLKRGICKKITREKMREEMVDMMFANFLEEAMDEIFEEFQWPKKEGKG